MECLGNNVHFWTDRKVFRQTDEQRKRQINKLTDRQYQVSKIWKDRNVFRQTDELRNRQIVSAYK